MTDVTTVVNDNTKGTIKAFISQPMRGRSDEEILKEREELIEIAKEKMGNHIEILDTFFGDYNGNAVQFLGKSIMKLGEADVALFGKGWNDARGCKIEHTVCEAYNIKTIEI